MSALKARERRQPVRIAGRLKSGRGWSDVVIGNVSSRGMMGVCTPPPARGDYVEVRCGSYVIVARVAWTAGARFGARAQDCIELPELLAGNTGTARPDGERRAQARAADPRKGPKALAERSATSARFARAMDFFSLVVVGVALAAMAAGAAHEALAKPLDTVATAMAAGADQ